jgi:hypothetical protein
MPGRRRGPFLDVERDGELGAGERHGNGNCGLGDAAQFDAEPYTRALR